jgi:4-hydroxybenzoate polyprenyltransferase/phosphoserine phosphatase
MEKPKVLALDLDGTLLGTDSLWEMFFKALSEGRTAPLLWLLQGRLAFKRRLAETTDLDFDRLPWNGMVIELAKEHQARGGEVWLATAANGAMARKVVERFDFLSGYLATGSRVNLKAGAKARALTERFGERGFIYAGDSAADLKVWPYASEAVVVGPPSLAEKARTVCGTVRTVRPVGTKLTSLAMAAELAWSPELLKNLLLFVPMLTTLHDRLTEIASLVLTFLVMCLYSAAGSVLGRLLSVSEDRRDPLKAGRVLAAGRLDLTSAAKVLMSLLSAGFSLSLVAGPEVLAAATVLAALVLVETYSRGRRVLPGLVFEVLSQVLRLALGYLTLSVPISPFTVAFALFAFAAIGSAKAVVEQAGLPFERPVGLLGGLRLGRGPALRLLFLAWALCTALSCAVVAVYVGCVWSGSVYAYPGRLLISCPVVFLLSLRLAVMIMSGRLTDDPFLFMLTDPQCRVGLIMLFMVYFSADPSLSN